MSQTSLRIIQFYTMDNFSQLCSITSYASKGFNTDVDTSDAKTQASYYISYFLPMLLNTQANEMANQHFQ